MRFSRLAATALLIVPHLAGLAAADDFKIIKLEQDVRALERQVQVLSRQIDELRLAATRAGDKPSSTARSAPVPAVSFDTWLSVSNWDRLRNGMTELEVIDALGAPTSMRVEGDTRILLYAMEIGASGFLSGSVSLQDRQVVEVQKPVLK